MFGAVAKHRKAPSNEAAAGRRSDQGDGPRGSREGGAVGGGSSGASKSKTGGASGKKEKTGTGKKGTLLGEEEEERAWGDLGLEDWLVRSCDSMGLKRPTDVQWNCIPPALQGRNIMASAKTGSGKTAAFALPILQNLSMDPYGVYALVLTPTRELAFQIKDQFSALGTSMHLREEVVVGGMDMMKQAKALCHRPHVVIATPGRLADHVLSSNGVKDALKRVAFVVFDEADRLLEECFASHLSTILEVLPERRTTMLFSATITASISELQEMSMVDCFQFAADDPKTTVDTVKEQYCHMPVTVKDCYLAHLVRNTEAESLIIFTATRKTCQYVCLLLEELGEEVCALHSDLKQQKRLASLDKFKGGRVRILVATDVASRGLDIPTVELVINYDIPKVATDYIHRVGRTARAGRSGTAISLITQYDVELLHRVEEHTGKKLEDAGVREDDVLELLTEVMKGRRVARVKMLELDSEGQDERRRGGLKRKHE